jgi:hypothetical protein
LAAHNLRELLTELPKHIGVDVKATQERLGDKALVLFERWKDAKGSSSCFDSGEWDGEIDPPLRNLLNHINDFVSWLDTHRPRRKAVVAAVLRRIDSAIVALPQPIEQEHIKDWNSYYTYFVRIAHHNVPVLEEEFRKRTEGLERYLLERLLPRTFEEMAEIDELIQKAEGNDQS